MSNWKRKFILTSMELLTVLAFVFMVIPTAAAPTCPDGGGWTKIDSGDLSAYPVSGATEYCFKAGTEVYDDRESWKSSGKDLSHWSYFIPQHTATSVPTTVPTETPTSTQEPTNTPAPTNTPGSTPTYTATPGRTSTGTPTSTPWTATPSSDPRIPCPCVETIIIQGEGGVDHDHIALWAVITLLAGTNGAWMIKRRKLGK